MGRRGSQPFAYDTNEHFTGALPFVGMRVSVSQQDIKELRTGGVQLLRGADAYPTSENGKAKAQ